MVNKSAEGLIAAVKPDPPLIIAAGAVTLALSCLSNLTILFRLIDTHCVSIHFSKSLLPESYVADRVGYLDSAPSPSLRSRSLSLTSYSALYRASSLASPIREEEALKALTSRPHFT